MESPSEGEKRFFFFEIDLSFVDVYVDFEEHPVSGDGGMTSFLAINSRIIWP